MRFRHFLPIALLCGALVGLIDARAQMWQPAPHGTPSAGGGGGGGGSPTVIAFQKTTYLGNSGGATANFTWNYTTVSNVNTGLVVSFVANGGAPPTSFKFNTSTNCTHVADVSAASTFITFNYFCPVGALAPGSYPITVTTATANTTVAACAWEYSGVNQSTPVEAVTGPAQVFITPATLSVTTIADSDWGVGIGLSIFGAGSPTGAGGAYAFRDTGCASPTGVGLVDSNAPVHPAGSTVPSITYTKNGGGLDMISFGLIHG